MLKIWIVGRGRMGGAVEAEIAACEDLALAGASEYVPEADSIGAADVIIDFSHPNNPRPRKKRPSCIRRISPRALRFLSACWPKCAA